MITFSRKSSRFLFDFLKQSLYREFMSKVNFSKKIGKERDRMCLLKQKSSFFPFSCLIAVLFFSICSQCSTTKHFVYFRTPHNLKYTFCIITNTFLSSKLLHLTQNEFIMVHFSAKSCHFKTDQKHLSGRLLKAFCFQLYTLP